MMSLCRIQGRAYGAHRAFDHDDPSTKAVAFAAQRMTNGLSKSRSSRDFDVSAETARLRAETRAMRRRRHRSFRLDRYAHELLSLYDAVSTITELASAC